MKAFYSSVSFLHYSVRSKASAFVLRSIMYRYMSGYKLYREIVCGLGEQLYRVLEFCCS